MKEGIARSAFAMSCPGNQLSEEWSLAENGVVQDENSLDGTFIEVSVGRPDAALSVENPAQAAAASSDYRGQGSNRGMKGVSKLLWVMTDYDNC